MLRWPFRIVLYLILYVAWLSVALMVLAAFPSMSGLQATNILPAGWIPIAGAFFADLYFSQLRRKK